MRLFLSAAWFRCPLRWVIQTMLIVLPLLCANVARATTISCDLTGMNGLSPDVGATTFGRDAPTGSTTPAYSTTLSFHCPGDPCCDRDVFVTFAASPAALVPGYNDVYPTNVPGLGVRFTLANGAGAPCRNLPLTVSNGSYQMTCHQLVAAASPGYDYKLTISATFVKTGKITSGPLTTLPVLSITNALNNQAGSSPWGNAVTGRASGSFNSIACSVKQSDIQVTMPQARTLDIDKVGATTGATSLNLSLDCDAGARVAVTLSDVTTPSNRSTTLSLTQDSTAKGIGYQISFGGVPIAFGADSAVAGNTNQIFVSPRPTSGGPLSVPLSVSYVRTGPVSPGSANAKTTFTMSYQ